MPKKCIKCLFGQYILLPGSRRELIHYFKVFLFLYFPIHCKKHCPNDPNSPSNCSYNVNHSNNESSNTSTPHKTSHKISHKTSNKTSNKTSSEPSSNHRAARELEHKIIRRFFKNMDIFMRLHGDERIGRLLSFFKIRGMASSETLQSIASLVQSLIKTAQQQCHALQELYKEGYRNRFPFFQDAPSSSINNSSSLSFDSSSSLHSNTSSNMSSNMSLNMQSNGSIQRYKNGVNRSIKLDDRQRHCGRMGELGYNFFQPETGSLSREQFLEYSKFRIEITRQLHLTVMKDIFRIAPTPQKRDSLFVPRIRDEHSMWFLNRYAAALQGQREFDCKKFRGPLTVERYDEVGNVEEQRDKKFLWGKISLKGRRKSMEDVLTIIPDFGEMLPPKLRPFKTFFGVFDGHNGRAAPNFCKDFIHVNTALYATQGHSLKDCFLHAHRHTETEFKRAAVASSDHSGSTALTVALNSTAQCAVVANLGDCRAVLCRRGRFTTVTRDHTPRDAAEARRVAMVGGNVSGSEGDERVDGKLSVSRTIGDVDLRTGNKLLGLSARPDVFSVDCSGEFEFLLFGCDGVWEQNSTEALGRVARRLLRTRKCPQRAVDGLAQHLVKERFATDNITMIMITSLKKDPKTGASYLVKPEKRDRRAPSFRKRLKLVNSTSLMKQRQTK